jgi:antirestriction protein
MGSRLALVYGARWTVARPMLSCMQRASKNLWNIMTNSFNTLTSNEEESAADSLVSSIEGEAIDFHPEIAEAMEAHAIDPDGCESAIRVSTVFKASAFGNDCGVWLDPLAYSSYGAFIEACREVHFGEVDPQFAFVDWKGIPPQFITASSVDSVLWLHLSDWQQLGDDGRALSELYWANFSTSVLIEKIEERFVGCFDRERDVGWHLLELNGYLEETPEELHSYLDCASYANDKRLNGEFSWIHHGSRLYVFWEH